MQTTDDLFGGPQGTPRTDKLIPASIQWAGKIMEKIDERFSAGGMSMSGLVSQTQSSVALVLFSSDKSLDHGKSEHGGMLLQKFCSMFDTQKRLAVFTMDDNFGCACLHIGCFFTTARLHVRSQSVTLKDGHGAPPKSKAHCSTRLAHQRDEQAALGLSCVSWILTT